MINRKKVRIGRRGFVKTLGSASVALGLGPLTVAGYNRASAHTKRSPEEVESGSNLSSRIGPEWLDPDYRIIDQLPPDRANGYFMAPSLVKMPSGTLVAAASWGTHYPDGEKGLQMLFFYRSTDNGATWEKVSRLPYDSCEPHLYVHEGRLYLIITPQHSNHKLERSYFPRDDKWGMWTCASDDEGATWTPVRRVIEGDAGYPRHAAGGQVAKLEHNGKLYLTVSHRFQKLAAASCDLEQGILNPDAWRISEMVELPNPPELFYKPRDYGSRLIVFEGNVVKVAGRLLVHARAIINRGATANMGAIFEIFDKGDSEAPRLEFLHFYPIPGGQMKYYILYDEPSQLYWMASTPATNSMFLKEDGPWEEADRRYQERRGMMLWYSVDSLNWIPAGWIAFAQGWNQSFHYPVMVIDGNDIVLVSRTARHSGNRHDVDLITFHHIREFRNLAMNLTPIP